jgi:hypothetical protein
MNGDVAASLTLNSGYWIDRLNATKAFAVTDAVEDIKADVQSTDVSPSTVNVTNTVADVMLPTTNTSETVDGVTPTTDNAIDTEE